MNLFRLKFLFLLVVGLSACKLGSSPDGEMIKPDALVAIPGTDAGLPYASVTEAQPKLSAAEMSFPVEAILPYRDCRLPMPKHNAKLVYVRSYSGGVKTPMIVKRDNEEPRAFERTDVLVTAKDKPVFLVLDSYRPVAWNIQAAPGARIDGVIANGHDGSVVFNGAAPSRTAILSRFTEDKSCRLRLKSPPRTPARIEAAFRADGSLHRISPENRRRWAAEYKEASKTFDADIRKHLKRSPDVSLEATSQHPAVLIGPAPSAPLQQVRPQKMQIIAGDKYTWGSTEVGVPIKVAARNQVAKRSAVTATRSSEAFLRAQERNRRIASAPPDASLPKPEVSVRLPGCSLEVEWSSKTILGLTNALETVALAIAIKQASSKDEAQRFAEKIATGGLRGTTFVSNRMERYDLGGLIFSVPEIEEENGVYLAQLEFASNAAGVNLSRGAFYQALANSVDSSTVKSRILKLNEERAKAGEPLGFSVGLNDVTEWTDKDSKWARQYFAGREKALLSPDFTHFAFREMIAVDGDEEKLVFGRVRQPKILEVYGRSRADLKKQLAFLKSWQSKHCR